MTIGMNLRKALSGSILALAMAAAMIVVPLGAQANSDNAAPAGVAVCNTANGSGGDMVVDGLDPQNPVHYSNGLRAMGNGNINAAMHSRALSLCSVPSAPSGGSNGDSGSNTPVVTVGT